MEFKGTKGSWEVDKSNERTVLTDNGSYRPNAINMFNCTEVELIANAKLIAAAPDLLEALQELKNRFELIDDSELWKEDYNAMYKARKAIEKALK